MAVLASSDREELMRAVCDRLAEGQRTMAQGQRMVEEGQRMLRALVGGAAISTNAHARDLDANYTVAHDHDAPPLQPAHGTNAIASAVFGSAAASSASDAVIGVGHTAFVAPSHTCPRGPKRAAPPHAAPGATAAAVVTAVPGDEGAAITAAATGVAAAVSESANTSCVEERPWKRRRVNYKSNMVRYDLPDIIARAEEILATAPVVLTAFNRWKSRRYLSSSGYAAVYVLYHSNRRAAEEAHTAGVALLHGRSMSGTQQRNKFYGEFRKRARELHLPAGAREAVDLFRRLTAGTDTHRTEAVSCGVVSVDGAATAAAT